MCVENQNKKRRKNETGMTCFIRSAFGCYIHMFFVVIVVVIFDFARILVVWLLVFVFVFVFVFYFNNHMVSLYYRLPEHVYLSSTSPLVSLCRSLSLSHTLLLSVISK